MQHSASQVSHAIIARSSKDTAVSGRHLLALRSVTVERLNWMSPNLDVIYCLIQNTVLKSCYTLMHWRRACGAWAPPVMHKRKMKCNMVHGITYSRVKMPILFYACFIARS